VLIRVVWEFIVRDDHIAEFEKFYSATGSWATLFRGNPGYLGTDLLRDSQNPHRYLTLDRWDSVASHAAMRERFAKDYDALDRMCEQLMETERQIGVFEDAQK
jgi:heme-degrading monooxygenase HmoA